MIRLYPDEIFLPLRLFTHGMKRLYPGATERFLEHMEEFINTSPDLIEWEEVDKMFEAWLSEIMIKGNNPSSILGSFPY